MLVCVAYIDYIGIKNCKYENQLDLILHLINPSISHLILEQILPTQDTTTLNIVDFHARIGYSIFITFGYHVGQIELFSHVPVLKNFVEHLRRKNFNVCAVYLLDSQVCKF